VDPKTNVEYLDYLETHLREFTAAFDEFMALHVENTGMNALARGIASAVFRRDGADPCRVGALTKKLNLLAGKLMELADVTGTLMSAVTLVDGF
jgi:hypothetical protein